MLPDCASAENLAAKLARRRASSGVERIDFYHYGLAPLTALDRIRGAATSWTPAVGRPSRSARPARSPRQPAAVHREAAVDRDVGDPLRQLLGILVGGRVPDGLRVEADEVGRHARPHEPAVGKPSRWAGSDVIFLIAPPR